MKKLINQHKINITLAVLKLMGPGNKNAPLSFPMEGYTLAMDMPRNEKAVLFIKSMNELIIRSKGRVYLAKDALLDDGEFKIYVPPT